MATTPCWLKIEDEDEMEQLVAEMRRRHSWLDRMAKTAKDLYGAALDSYQLTAEEAERLRVALVEIEDMIVERLAREAGLI